MLIEILRRTPPWVFILFFVLLAYGIAQMRPRVLTRTRVAILPLVMLGLSFAGVVSAFGTELPALGAWLLGGAVAVVVGLGWRAPRGVTWSALARTFSVPGSGWPLALMMAIFFLKYAVGVSVARHLSFVDSPAFAPSISATYGFLSGLFLARAMVIVQAARSPF